MVMDLKIPGWPLSDPLKQYSTKGPDVRTQGGSFLAYQHFWSLVWVQENNIFSHRVFNEKLLKIPKTKIGDFW